MSGTPNSEIPVLVKLVSIYVKEWRERNGLKQSELAERLGILRESLSDLENGRLRRLSLDYVENVCTTLDVSLVDLLGWDDRGKLALERFGLIR